MLTVGQLAGRTRVSPDTIRYYERVGLLPPPERTTSGYRSYDESYAERIRFVQGAQSLGLRLREIRELLEVIDRGLCPCGHTEALLRKRLSEIEREQAQLRDLKKQLESLADQLPENEPPDADQWPCQKEFIRVGGGAKSGS